MPAHLRRLTKKPLAQAAAARVDQDELTVPGAPPGIYACAYRELAAILALLAEGGLALAHGDHAGAQVPHPPTLHSMQEKTMDPFQMYAGMRCQTCSPPHWFSVAGRTAELHRQASLPTWRLRR